MFGTDRTHGSMCPCANMCQIAKRGFEFLGEASIGLGATRVQLHLQWTRSHPSRCNSRGKRATVQRGKFFEVLILQVVQDMWRPPQPRSVWNRSVNPLEDSRNSNGFLWIHAVRTDATVRLPLTLFLRSRSSGMDLCNWLQWWGLTRKQNKKTKHIKYKQNTCLLMKNLRWIFVFFFCVFPTFAVQVSFGSREAVATCNIDENCLAIIALSKPQRSHCNFIEQDDFRKSKQS